MMKMIKFAQLRESYKGLTMVCSNPMLGYVDDVVSKSECDYIIQLAKGRLKRAQVSLDDKSAVIENRSGSNAWVRYSEDDIVEKIGHRIADIVGIPLENAEAMQVIHYGPGQEYRAHFDSYDLSTRRGQRCCQNGGQRLLTSLVYLNSVDEGGATYFPKLKAGVETKMGRMAVFHNVGDDYLKPHPSSLHAGTPVIRGEKWAFNIWFRARPMAEIQEFDRYPELEGKKDTGDHIIPVSRDMAKDEISVKDLEVRIKDLEIRVSREMELLKKRLKTLETG